MQVEYEATFENVDKNDIREKLESIGAVLIRPEFMQRRTVFNMPDGHGVTGGWLRVRDEGDKITMSLKAIDGEGIERQKETEIVISDYESGVHLLESIGCVQKAYQESLRELWRIDEVDVTIDEWPFLEPYIEVEGLSEEVVKEISEKLGFDYGTALFDSVDAQYSKKYNITIDAVNQRTPKILFDMENPFINRND